MPRPSLGAIPLPPETIERDLTLLERFQEFSAELLRIALVAISALGFAISKVLFPENAASTQPLAPSTKYLLIAALIVLGTSAASALVHRYYAVDSMSWHLQALRRSIRNLPGDEEKAQAEYKIRVSRFNIAQNAIRVSAASLAIGAFLVVAALVSSLW